jgi:hypothetical protein
VGELLDPTRHGKSCRACSPALQEGAAIPDKEVTRTEELYTDAVVACYNPVRWVRLDEPDFMITIVVGTP